MRLTICCRKVALRALGRVKLRYYSKKSNDLEKVKVGEYLIPKKYEKKVRQRALDFVRTKMAQGDVQLEQALAPLQAAVKEQVG